MLDLTNKPDCAIIGMGKMGSALMENCARSGLRIAIYSRYDSETMDAYKSHPEEQYTGKIIPVTGKAGELVKRVGGTGIYFLVITAGAATENMLNELKPFLRPGAIIVDLANSHWADTERRCRIFMEKGIDFFGCGISGGVQGALYGASLMPGGTSREVYVKRVKPILDKIAAKAPGDGQPCVCYCGSNGSGHFIKMVHNGIEYGIMQLLAEAYGIMSCMGLSADAIGDIFDRWNQSRLASYLCTIMVKLCRKHDPSGSSMLIDKILDTAEMNGTGNWTVATALQMEKAVPVPTIAAAVWERMISARRNERINLSPCFNHKIKWEGNDHDSLLNMLEKALHFSYLLTLAQGIEMIENHGDSPDGRQCNNPELLKIWRAGSIIQMKLLDEIIQTYTETPGLSHLLNCDSLKDQFREGYTALAEICMAGARMHIPLTAFEGTRLYFLQYTRPRSTACIIQGLRDIFGGHTYRRIDRPGSYHIHWWGTGEEIEV